MKKLATVILISGFAFTGMRSFALDQINPALTKRQSIEQMISCVKKRVATRFVSYDQAIRSCREDANSEEEDASPKALTVADRSAKR